MKLAHLMKKVFTLSVAGIMFFSCFVYTAFATGNNESVVVEEYDFETKTTTYRELLKTGANTSTSTYDFLPQEIRDQMLQMKSSMDSQAMVPGSDFTHVSPIRAPYSGAVLLVCEAMYEDDEKPYMTGLTGFLVSPRVIVTAAHGFRAVKEVSDGELASGEMISVKVYQGVSKDIAGSFDNLSDCEYVEVKSRVMPLEFEKTGDKEYDWCVAILKEPIEGVGVSYFDCAMVSNEDKGTLMNHTMAVVGYPGTHWAKLQKSTGIIKCGYVSNCCSYYGSTMGGSSGSPLYDETTTKCYAIIVAEYDDKKDNSNNFNVGRLITWEVYDAILDAMISTQ